MEKGPYNNSSSSVKLSYIIWVFFADFTKWPSSKMVNYTFSIFKLKVYTEGFRVLLLNGTVIGCKSINLYPIV